METKGSRRLFSVLVLSALLLAPRCATKKSVRASTQKIAPDTSIMLVVDCPTGIQNVVYSRFINSAFRVKAFNASDLRAPGDIFDVGDFKKIAHRARIKEVDSLLSAQKESDSLYKLHIYNYEISKAETLGEIRDKWKVRYLVLLELNDWEKVSWGRAVDLDSYELVWVENYATRYSDTLVTVVDHFIQSLQGK